MISWFDNTRFRHKESIAAGMLVGIGDIVNMTLDNKYIAAMLFSLALLTIIHERYRLYTGMIGFYNTWDKDVLIVTLVWNCIGALIPTLVYVWSPNGDTFLKVFNETASTKYSCSVSSMFFAGILCGICMYIAVAAKDTTITVFAIMVFILAGFRHCIAEFPIAWMAAISNPANIAHIASAWIACVIGNTCGSIGMHIITTHKDMNTFN